MTKLPMAKLMTQNSKDLWVVASLFFVLWQKIQNQSPKISNNIKPKH